jgi:predicted component of type VI protein secretion system
MVLFRKKKESCEKDRIVQLSIVKGNNDTGDTPGKIFDLQCGNNYIGRDPTCEVPLKSETVSRRHANLKVSYDKQKFSVADLGSSNGTIIRPSTILRSSKKPLKSGDEFQTGEILFRLLAIDQNEALQTMKVDIEALMHQAQDKEKNKKKKD